MLMRACSVVKAKDVLRGVVVQLDVTVYVNALSQEKAPAPSRSPQNETGTQTRRRTRGNETEARAAGHRPELSNFGQFSRSL